MTVIKNPKHTFAEKIFIDNDEDIIFVIDKIKFAESRRILLISSQHALLTSSVINLKLVARKAADLGKTVILVTKNELARLKSKETGLHTVSKPEEITEKTWEHTEKTSANLKMDREERKQLLIKQRQENVTSKSEVDREYTETEVDTIITPLKPIAFNPKKIVLGSFVICAGGDIETSEYKEELIKKQIPEQSNEAKKIEENIDISESRTNLPDVEKKTSKNTIKLEPQGVKISKKNIFGISISEDKSGKKSTDAQELTMDKKNTKKQSNKQNNKFLLGRDISGINLKQLKRTDSSRGSRRSSRSTSQNPIVTLLKEKKIIQYLGLGLALFFGLSLLGKSMAKASIEIIPASEVISVTETIIADESVLRVSIDDKTIPLRKITQKRSSSESGTPTTKAETGNNSKGVVDFLNKTDEQITLSAGTIVTTLNGNKSFFLDETIQVPPRVSEITPSVYENAPITATNYGETYNLSEMDMKIEGYNTITQLSGRIYRPTVGGTTKVATVVSEEEVNALKEKLANQIKDMLRNDIKALLSDEDILLEGVEQFEELAFEVSPEIGQEADRFDIINLEYSLSLYIVGQEDIDKIADEVLTSESTDSDVRIRADQAASVENITILEDNKISLEITKAGEANSNIDLVSIKRSVSGLSIDEAKAKLKSDSQIKTFTLETKPFFIPKSLRRLPEDVSKISIIEK